MQTQSTTVEYENDSYHRKASALVCICSLISVTVTINLGDLFGYSSGWSQWQRYEWRGRGAFIIQNTHSLFMRTNYQSINTAAQASQLTWHCMSLFRVQENHRQQIYAVEVNNQVQYSDGILFATVGANSVCKSEPITMIDRTQIFWLDSSVQDWYQYQ